MFFGQDYISLSHRDYFQNHFPDTKLQKLPILVPNSFLDVRSEEAKSEEF